jgi:hypothetical protein
MWFSFSFEGRNKALSVRSGKCLRTFYQTKFIGEKIAQPVELQLYRVYLADTISDGPNGKHLKNVQMFSSRPISSLVYDEYITPWAI